MARVKLEEAKTLWERWQAIADKTPEKEAIVHWTAGEEPFRWNYGDLVETANKFSLALKKNGIKRGEVCAIILKHNPMFYPLYMGISGAGALPAVLAYPNPRLHPDKFRQGLLGMSQRSGLDRVLTQKDLEGIIRPFIEMKESTVDELMFPLEWDLDNVSDVTIKDLEVVRNKIQATDAMLLQHSSGTTGLQKPVVLSHKAILDHVAQYGEALKIDENDIVVSWLPLYHDMGLVGAFQIPLASGITSIQIDTFEWILAPVLMFEATHKEKATMCWLPNFAYNLCADKVPDDEMEGFDLSSLRLVINASEPIRSESHKRFLKKFEKYNLNPLSLSTLYGMAEVTLAFSQNPPGQKVNEITVDRQKLAQGIVKLADETTEVKRVCVSSGVLIPDTEMKIVRDDRSEVGENEVGEIVVKSICLFEGYRNYPEKTAECMDDEGWYYSGDYGFVYNGELYVIGRKKDIIIVAGKNIYPEDVEVVLNGISQIIPGRVIAFGEDDELLGTEQISVVAETKLTDPEDLRKLRLDIIRAAMTIDVNIGKVYLVPSRWLIKSSSGKPSRKANKERLIAGKDEVVWTEEKLKKAAKAN
jgi:fatty-acyl-CoA synthase